MFYIKATIADGVTLKSEITDENVFTVCPGCGNEHSVDLAAVLSGDCDLYSTQIYCEACSERELSRCNK